MTLKPITSAISLTIALVFIFASATVGFANILIKFPPGKSETTISGRIATGRKACYFVNGKAGQTLSAQVSSKSGFVSIFESGETEYEYVLDVPGKASICVDNLGRSTTFSLTVSIK
jgi:hypothetical protein